MSSTEQGRREGLYSPYLYLYPSGGSRAIRHNFFFINFYNFCHYSTSISGHALWPIWCGRCRRVADIDIAYGRYGVVWPIWSWPIWFVADIVVSPVAEWYGAGLATVGSSVRIPPVAAVYQRQLSVPSLRGR